VTPVAWFERLTKRAVGLSSLLIACLLIGFHPDTTATLRVLGTLALVAGWLSGGSRGPWVISAWAAAAVLAPAPLRLLAGREGPVLDVFWMAGLTAALMRSTTWSGWALGPPTRLLAAAWALTLVVGWPVLAARELAFTPSLLFDFGAVNAWTGWTAPHVASWIAVVAWSHLLGLLWLDWLSARLAATSDWMPQVLHPFWVATTLASLVTIYQGLIDLEALNTTFWASLYRASGTMLDANAYGICAALAGATAFLALHRGARPRALTIAAVVTAINVVGLWMSGARVSALCGVLALGALAVAMWRTGGFRRVLGVAAAAGGVAALVIVASGATGPAKRLFERPDGATGGFVSTVLLREPYGPVAHHIIRDYPITGVGLGMYPHLAADYWRREADQGLPFDNAQNWWRHQAAELGLLGGLPLFAWSVVLAWQVVFGRSRRDRVFEATLVRGLLFALGASSVMQMPTQTPVVLLWFFVLVAWLPHLLAGHRTPEPRGAHAVAIGLALAYAASHVMLARGPLAVAERARTFSRPYVVGAYDVETTEGGSPFRWTSGTARFVWPARTPWFVIDLWASHPDIVQQPVTVSVTTPCQTLVEWTFKGPERLSLGLTLPPGQTSIEATVRVSRTWQPSAFGHPDTRNLGVGVSADSVQSQERARSAQIPLDLAPC
jgi:hypothetical protein